MKRNKNNKQPKLHIKKEDTVKVIAGNDRGKQGRVLMVLPKESRVIVEGINMVTKHVKPSANNPNGGIEKKEWLLKHENAVMPDKQLNLF